MFERLTAVNRTCLAVLLFSLAMLSACGTSSTTAKVGLPTPTPVGAVNAYVGQPGNSGSDASLWNVTIDRSNNVYSYGPAGGTSTNGAILPTTGGSLILLDQNGYQDGLALEAPGSAILLRPGDSTNPLLFAVQQSSCFEVTGNVKFLFNLTPGVTGSDGAVYGKIYANTSTDGNTWQFNNQTQYQEPDGKDVPANADSPTYPGAYPGTCSTSNGAAAITASSSDVFSNGTAYQIPIQYIINQSGFFFESQDYGILPSTVSWPYTNVSAWGISESPTPMSVGSFATARYIGFLSEENVSSGVYRTRFVGFGNAPTSGTVMTGGTLPNEDATQAPTINMSVTFGSQDPLNNGVYYLTKLSIPYDGNQSSCPNPTPNSNGILSCTYNAVALVSNLNVQYVIMVNAFDANGNQKLLVLFQI